MGAAGAAEEVEGLRRVRMAVRVLPPVNVEDLEIDGRRGAVLARSEQRHHPIGRAVAELERTQLADVAKDRGDHRRFSYSVGPSAARTSSRRTAIRRLRYQAAAMWSSRRADSGGSSPPVSRTGVSPTAPAQSSTPSGCATAATEAIDGANPARPASRRKA